MVQEDADELEAPLVARPSLSSSSPQWKASRRLEDLPWDFSVAPSLLEYSRMGRFLSILLGILACLDFGAAMVNRHVSHCSDQTLGTLVEFLQDYDNTLGICFSLLWFVDTFVWAHRNRLQAAQKHDRMALLNADETLNPEWWTGFRWVFYRTVLVQILLLPVGFYVFWYGLLVNNPDSRLEIVHHDEHVEDETETFSSHAKISLLFAILKHLSITIARRTGTKLRLQWKSIFRNFLWRHVRFGIRHPLALKRKIQRTLRTIRWVQYLAPLIGAANKLKGAVGDLVIKYRQHRDMEQAKKIRKKLWANLSQKDLHEICAVLIQKTFRSHQTRRHLYVLKLIRGKKETVAAIRLQSVFRGALDRARARLKGKWRQLQALKEMQRQALRKHTPVMSADERRRMYELQQELEDEARIWFNEKLLLRPNTAFAVTWKILFVVAVLFEISTLACKPLLEKYKDRKGKPLDLETIMDQTFIPIPIANHTVCVIPRPSRVSWATPIRSVARIKEMVLERDKYSSLHLRPWWCTGWYPKVQGICVRLGNLFIRNFLIFVSAVCFTDVFVNFFMGKYNKESGALEPKPFFTRWILPGLLLQLLVNPKLESLSSVVFGALSGLLHHGPIRVIRWTLSLFYPLLLFGLGALRRMWYSSAAHYNHNLITSDTWRSMFAQTAIGATHYLDLQPILVERK